MNLFFKYAFSFCSISIDVITIYDFFKTATEKPAFRFNKFNELFFKFIECQFWLDFYATSYFYFYTVLSSARIRSKSFFSKRLTYT